MTQNQQSHWRNLIAACSAIAIFGLAFGMTYPLLSLILESRGVSPDMIGINAAMMPVGILLASSAIPVAVARFGSRQVAMVAAAATALLILGYKIFDHLSAWFVLRLLQGMTISTLFVLSEAWIVSYAADAMRGRVVAVYASVLSLCFSIGPALVGWIGIEGWMPFILGAIVILIGLVPLSLVQDSTDEPGELSEQTRTAGLFAFAAKAPMLLSAVLVFAFFDAATLALLPVYGINHGLSLPTAALALTALIIGNVVFQFPLGWLADQFNERRLLIGCSILCALTLALLPFVIGSIWMWPTLVVCGTLGYGIYTLSLTSLGNRFKGAELVEGTAAFAVVWGIGALLGTVTAGGAMHLFGPDGLPALLAITFLALGVGLIVRDSRRARSVR